LNFELRNLLNQCRIAEFVDQRYRNQKLLSMKLELDFLHFPKTGRFLNQNIGTADRLLGQNNQDANYP